jgi:hypothetical protein
MKKILALFVLLASFLAQAQTTSTRTKLKSLTTIPLSSTVYKIFERDTLYFRLDWKDHATAASDSVIVTKKGYRLKKQVHAVPSPAVVPPTIYNGSATFTANCPTGYSGLPQTATATATSTVSQVDANNKAATLAQQKASAALTCTSATITYSSTKTYTAHCSEGYIGAAVSRSATKTSTVSQADADTKALAQATIDANAALVCDAVVVGSGSPNTEMVWVSDSSWGGINGGANVLVLEVAMPNLQIGDQVLVIDPTLQYGTSGVGGQWPTNTGYASEAEMNRDTTQENGYYTWNRGAGGQVYRYDAGLHQWYEFHRNSHYIEKANPLSLVAIVQGISLDRKTIVLSRSAQKTVSHVKVYIDNAGRLQQFFPDYKSYTEGGGQFRIPAGRFAFSRIVGVKNHDVEIYGAGKDSTVLFCPPGVPGAGSIVFNQTDRVKIHDFTIDAGFKHTGWAFAPEAMPTSGGFDNPFAVTPTLGLWWHNNHAWNMRVINPMAYGFYIAGNDTWVDYSDVIFTPGDEPLDYVGWALLAAQANGGGYRYCTYTATGIGNAFEAFTSLDVSFLGCRATNGINSLNSSGGSLVRNFIGLYTPGSHNNNRINSGHPMWEANDFINGARDDRGATFDSVTLTQTGSLDAGGEYYLNGIYIRGENIINVTVKNYTYSRPDVTNATAGARGNALIATTNGAYLEKHYSDWQDVP